MSDVDGDRFRNMALRFPETAEKSHFGKPDFRVGEKIFAGFNDRGQAYAKLNPEQQAMLIEAEPDLAWPIPGGWGKKGWTVLDHKKADPEIILSVLTMAWRNVAPKKLQSACYPSNPTGVR